MVFAQKCNLKKGGINISLAQCFDENILSKYSAEEFMQNEDIVINSTGTGTLGRVGIYHHSDNPLKLKVVPDSHVTTVRVSSIISAYFVYIYLKSLQPYIENQGEGSTNQKELKPATIKNLILPIPSYDEQIRIVSRVKQVIKSLEEIEAALPRNRLFCYIPDNRMFVKHLFYHLSSTTNHHTILQLLLQR